LVKDNPKNSIAGDPMMNNLVELRRFCSLGNSKVNQRNAVGIIPDAAKLILPQNSLNKGSFKK
jgi:hypothetical protein